MNLKKTIFILTLFLGLSSASLVSAAEVVSGSVSTYNSVNITQWNLSYSVPTGHSNTALVVMLASNSNVGHTSVEYDSQELEQIYYGNAVSNSWGKQSLWILPNPSEGANALDIAFGASTAYGCTAIVFTVENVNQTKPFADIVFANGNASSSSVQVPNMRSGDLAIAAITLDNNGASVGIDTGTLAGTARNSYCDSGGGYNTGTELVEVGFTHASANFAIVGFRLLDVDSPADLYPWEFVAFAERENSDNGTMLSTSTALDVLAGDLLVANIGWDGDVTDITLAATTGADNSFSVFSPMKNAHSTDHHSNAIAYVVAGEDNPTSTFLATWASARTFRSIQIMQFRPQNGFGIELLSGPNNKNDGSVVQSGTDSLEGQHILVVGGASNYSGGSASERELFGNSISENSRQGSSFYFGSLTAKGFNHDVETDVKWIGQDPTDYVAGMMAFDFSSPADVFYSVGQSASNLMTGTPTVTLSSGTATFSEAQTGNIGVGDVVTYDTSQTCYISGKTSTSIWSCVTATGATPADIIDSTVVSIERVFTSLSSAETGAATLLGTSDLVTGNYVLNIPCYYDSGADTTTVIIDGWTTGANNYIKVYTPFDTATEANFSQRHEGVWDDGKYNLVQSGTGSALGVSSDYTQIVGLQAKKTSTSGWNCLTMTLVGAGVIVDSFIAIQENVSGSENYGNIALEGNVNPPIVIQNSIAIGSPGPGIAAGYDNKILNCLAYDNNVGLLTGSWIRGTIQNSIAISNATDFTYSGNPAVSSNNISSDSTAPGDNSITNATVQFMDEANHDFRLSGDDTSGAIDGGADLSAEMDALDIVGNSRPKGLAWDIGAFEAPAKIFRSVGPGATSALASGATNAMTIGSAVQRTGEVTMIESNLNSSSQSISVPSDAEAAVVGASGWNDEIFYFSGGVVSLGGQEFELGHTTDHDPYYQITALFYLVGPPTGSQTLVWDWSGSSNLSEGGHIFVAFYKGVDATSSPIRSAGGEQDSSATVSTGMLEAQNGDMAIAISSGYFNTGGSNGVTEWSGATEVIDDYYNQDIGSFAEAGMSGEGEITATISGGSGTTLFSVSGIVLKSSRTNIALFESELPDNVGVGDVIQYDSNDNGSIDMLAFIRSRISGSEFGVQSVSGGTQIPTLDADNDWAIYRAHTSLANADAGIENTGILADLRNFDDWTPGGDSSADEAGRDLVTNNEQWNIACYANGTTADSANVSIGYWATGVQNYIKIFTPYLQSEVGTSQRHGGKWDEGKYRFENSMDTVMLGCTVPHVKFIGLQIASAGTSGNQRIFSYGDIEVNGCILRRLYDGVTARAFVIENFYNVKAYNNILINFNGEAAIVDHWNRTGHVFANNTIIGSENYGFYLYGNTVLVNNIVIGSGNKDYHLGSGSWNAACSNNLSSDGTAPGANPKINATVQFLDSDNNDFHLAPTDTSALGAGTNLSSDANLPFSTDIDGETRARWDIGADEMLQSQYKMRGDLKFRGDVKLR